MKSLRFMLWSRAWLFKSWTDALFTGEFGEEKAESLFYAMAWRN